MTPREYLISSMNAVKTSNEGSSIEAVTKESLVQQYAYKVAYETDQKTVKPSITIYSNDLDSAIDNGVQALVRARNKLQEAGLVAAPLGEVQNK